MFFVIIEEDFNEKINGLGDGLWLSAVTVSTLGYGDIVPVTGYGKILATILSFGGFALLGAFAALVGRTILERWVRVQGKHLITIDTSRDEELEKAVRQLKNLSKMSKKELNALDVKFDKIFEKRIEKK